MNPEYGTGPELSLASRNFCTTEGCDPCIQNINEVQRIKTSLDQWKMDASTTITANVATQMIINLIPQIDRVMGEKFQTMTGQISQSLDENFQTMTGQINQGLDERFQTMAGQINLGLDERFQTMTGQINQGLDERFQTMAGQINLGLDERFQSLRTN